MIYFLIEAELPDGPVKIGSCKGSIGVADWRDNVRKRLVEMQVGNPRVLAIVALMNGGRVDEKALHRTFAEDRLRGEWFTRSVGICRLLVEHQREPMFSRSTYSQRQVLKALVPVAPLVDHPIERWKLPGYCDADEPVPDVETRPPSGGRLFKPPSGMHDQCAVCRAARNHRVRTRP